MAGGGERAKGRPALEFPLWRRAADKMEMRPEVVGGGIFRWGRDQIRK